MLASIAVIFGVLGGLVVGTALARRFTWRPSRMVCYAVVGLAVVGIVSASLLVRLYLHDHNAGGTSPTPLVLLFLWTLALASVARFAAYHLNPGPRQS